MRRFWIRSYGRLVLGVLRDFHCFITQIISISSLLPSLSPLFSVSLSIYLSLPLPLLSLPVPGWAHSAAETIESRLALETGKLIQLSVQQITSCTPNPQHCGTDGVADLLSLVRLFLTCLECFLLRLYLVSNMSSLFRMFSSSNQIDLTKSTSVR